MRSIFITSEYTSWITWNCPWIIFVVLQNCVFVLEFSTLDSKIAIVNLKVFWLRYDVGLPYSYACNWYQYKIKYIANNPILLKLLSINLKIQRYYLLYFKENTGLEFVHIRSISDGDIEQNYFFSTFSNMWVFGLSLLKAL